jgi:hypothetical protein
MVHTKRRHRGVQLRPPLAPMSQAVLEEQRRLRGELAELEEVRPTKPNSPLSADRY